jgi:antitoxin VapB
MCVVIRDAETEQMVRELARKLGVSESVAVKQAVDAQLRQDPEELRRRIKAIKAIQDEIAALPRSGLVADKAFFDDLSGD